MLEYLLGCWALFGANLQHVLKQTEYLLVNHLRLGCLGQIGEVVTQAALARGAAHIAKRRETVVRVDLVHQRPEPGPILLTWQALLIGEHDLEDARQLVQLRCAPEKWSLRE